jgi:hypothetical protein
MFTTPARVLMKILRSLKLKGKPRLGYVSKTDNTRPWKIRDADLSDYWRHMSYCKQWKNHSYCEYCVKGWTRKNTDRRKAINEQLDNPAG